MGCVLLLLGENDSPLQEADQGLVKTAAGFWESRWRTSDDISQNVETFWLLFAVQKHSKIRNAAYSRRLRHSVWQGKEGWLWRMSICPTSSV